MVKAILIDLDGTLIDSIPALYQVYQKFLEYYGKKGTKEEFNSLIGPSIDEIVAILQKKHDLKPPVHDLATMYVSTLMKQGFEGTELFPGAKKFIEEAKKKGKKLAIITSGTKPLVKTCLEPFKILDHFDAVITSEDVTKAKPNPDMYKLALDKLQVEAGDAIAIEDSAAGRDAAQGAGLKVIVITHGKPSTEKDSKDTIHAADWEAVDTWLKSQ